MTAFGRWASRIAGLFGGAAAPPPPGLAPAAELVMLFSMEGEIEASVIVGELQQRGVQPESIRVTGFSLVEVFVTPQGLEAGRQVLTDLRKEFPEYDWAKVKVAE